MIVAALLLYIWPAYAGMQLNSPENVSILIQKACGVPSKICFSQTLDRVWKKSTLVEKTNICKYLESNDLIFASSYIKDKLRREKDRISVYLLLNALINRNSIDDISFLANLIPMNKVIGREGETISDIVLLYLQRCIPMEYDFNNETFSKSQRYREEISCKYLQWIKKSSDQVQWSQEFRCFIVKGSNEKTVEKHIKWYHSLRQQIE